jgi:erythronate-4-phosphate dehydrogenase
MKIVADDKIPFLKGALEEKGVEVCYLPGAKIAKKDIADAAGLIVRTRTKCGAELLEGSKIKFIASATIGFDHIDTVYCAKNGIFWTNAPGCNSSSVAQYFCSAALNLACEKNLDLSSMTIGIAGVGNVGSKVAKIAKALGMRTLLNDPPRERKEGGDFVPLEKIISESDIITLHVPLNDHGIDKTFHIAGKDFFSAVRHAPIFINTSRGEVCDTKALKDAIRKQIISCAVIDVWENEPGIDLELLSLAKFATPHIAGYSTDGKANGTAMSVRAASRFFNLGADDWFPKNIPCPDNTELTISRTGNETSILSEIVNKTYDIRADDENLRKSPESFEKQRSEYYVRREFSAYSVNAEGIDEAALEKLKKIGFQIKQQNKGK